MKDPKILHREFVKLGRQRHRLMNEMLAILPEIYQSGVFRKYASSIVEYAGKYGGISRSAVEKRLRIEKYLKDLPELRESIKEVGVNKVAMVATLATSETEPAFVDKLKNMNKSAVATLSKEIRGKAGQNELFSEKDETNSSETKTSPNPLRESTPCQAIPQKITLELNEEMTFLFLKLKEKWGKTMSHKQIMNIMLEKTIETEFPKPKPRKSKKSITGDDLTNNKKPHRTAIPAQQKRDTLAKTNRKCAYKNCNKPATRIHHLIRYFNNRKHEKLVGVCDDHHQFLHNGLIPNEIDDPKNWKISINGQVTEKADKLYRKYRQKALL